MNLAPPSHDPTDYNSLEGAMRTMLRKFKQHDLDDMLPAQITAYDRGKNLAQF